MDKRKNIVYLYSEVMPYAIAVMRSLVHDFGMQVHCIRWDIHKRTPFEPVDEKGVTFYRRSDFNKVSLLKFITEKDPAIIYVVGRMDKLYLEAARHFRNKCTVVTGSDNQWTGSLRQRLGAMFSKKLYRRYFEYFWVPGRRQFEFARKMGYSGSHIINHLLSADDAIFGKVYDERRRVIAGGYPHTLVYAGRFAAVKGLDILIAAFNESKKELKNDWKLVVVGSGELFIAGSWDVEVMGYMTSAELAEASKNWGVFCLPSTYEPWGVVIHEFTMAGLPVICSNKVGAGDELVRANENGYIFSSGNKQELKKAIVNIMKKPDSELAAMGARSYEFSARYSPRISANSLMSILR